MESDSGRVRLSTPNADLDADETLRSVRERPVAMLVGNLKRNGLCPSIAQAAACETVLTTTRSATGAASMARPASQEIALQYPDIGPRANRLGANLQSPHSCSLEQLRHEVDPAAAGDLGLELLDHRVKRGGAKILLDAAGANADGMLFGISRPHDQ